MIELALHVDIYHPLAKVYSFVVQPENDFHWQYGTLRSARVSNGEIGLGVLFRVVGHFMGRRMESVYVVSEFEANRKYGFKSQSSPIESYVLYTFQEVKYNTRINVFAQFEPGSAWTARETAVAKTIRKQYRENLGLLKSFLEAGSAEDLVEDPTIAPGRRA